MEVIERNLDLGETGDITMRDLIILHPSNRIYSIDKLVEKMKLHERNFPISKYTQIVLDPETMNPVYNLHYECKSYWVTNPSGYTLTPKIPAISNEFIHYANYCANVYDIVYDGLLTKDHVKTYIGIKYGERAHKDFWTNMTLEEVLDICKFEVRYMQNIRNLEEARAFNVSNFLRFSIRSAVIDNYGIKFYEMAATARGAEILLEKPWLMNTMPRNYRDFITDEMFIDSISWLLKEHNVPISALKLKHIKMSKMISTFAYFNSNIKNLRKAYVAYQEGGYTNLEQYTKKPMEHSIVSRHHLKATDRPIA